MMRKLPLLAACGLLLAGCGGKGSDLENIKKAGFINIGYTMYEPMDYLDSDGETLVGFDADLANAFAESLGVKARFVLIKWDSKVLELNGGSIDLIWNGMTITEELKKTTEMSLAYATNYQCVVTRASNIGDYTSVSSLAGKSIAVESGSAGNDAANTVTGAGAINAVTAQVNALTEVKTGASDCAIIDVTMANSLVGSGDFADLATVSSSYISFDKEDFGVGARKGSDIIPELNAFFKAKYDDGTLTQLGTQYGVAINDEAFRA